MGGGEGHDASFVLGAFANPSVDDAGLEAHDAVELGDVGVDAGSAVVVGGEPEDERHLLDSLRGLDEHFAGGDVKLGARFAGAVRDDAHPLG